MCLCFVHLYIPDKTARIHSRVYWPDSWRRGHCRSLQRYSSNSWGHWSLLKQKQLPCMLDVIYGWQVDTRTIFLWRQRYVYITTHTACLLCTTVTVPHDMLRPHTTCYGPTRHVTVPHDMLRSHTAPCYGPTWHVTVPHDMFTVHHCYGPTWHVTVPHDMFIVNHCYGPTRHVYCESLLRSHMTCYGPTRHVCCESLLRSHTTCLLCITVTVPHDMLRSHTTCYGPTRHVTVQHDMFRYHIYGL
jgi:hypothetical protein